jgi:hypothetical protein
VIAQVQRLPSKNGADKTMRRVLIFDNHPDSLRLVFGRSGHPQAPSSNLQPMAWPEVGLIWILVATLMVAMFWPLF